MSAPGRPQEGPKEKPQGASKWRHSWSLFPAAAPSFLGKGAFRPGKSDHPERFPTKDDVIGFAPRGPQERPKKVPSLSQIGRLRGGHPVRQSAKWIRQESPNVCQTESSNRLRMGMVNGDGLCAGTRERTERKKSIKSSSVPSARPFGLIRSRSI